MGALNLNPDDVALLTEGVEVVVELRPSPSLGMEPVTLSIEALAAEAFGITYDEALGAFEGRVRVRYTEVIEDQSPTDLREDRATALPVALKLWSLDRRGALRRTIEDSLHLAAQHAAA